MYYTCTVNILTICLRRHWAYPNNILQISQLGHPLALNEPYQYDPWVTVISMFAIAVKAERYARIKNTLLAYKAVTLTAIQLIHSASRSSANLIVLIGIIIISVFLLLLTILQNLLFDCFALTFGIESAHSHSKNNLATQSKTAHAKCCKPISNIPKHSWVQVWLAKLIKCIWAGLMRYYSIWKMMC